MRNEVFICFICEKKKMKKKRNVELKLIELQGKGKFDVTCKNWKGKCKE